MPYKTTAELPVTVKDKYSEAAQTAFMSAFNDVFKATKDEGRSMAAAHMAAKKVDKMTEGYVSDNDVVRLSEAVDGRLMFDGTFEEVTKDEASGLHRARVTMIRPGMSSNKFYYSQGFIKDKLEPMVEGLKCFANHPKDKKTDPGNRSIRDLMGWYSNPKVEDDGSLTSDLNFLPGNDHLVEALSLNPQLLGLSIHADGKVSRGKLDGKTCLIAESCEKFWSTDLVPEAAAGGTVDAVRMVASLCMENIDESEDDMEDDKLTASWLLAERDYRFAEAEKKVGEYETKMTEVAWFSAESEYNTREWLDAEQTHMREAKIDEAPEQFRDYLRESGADVARFMEALKSEPATATGNPPATPAPVAKPGEAGFNRKFL